MNKKRTIVVLILILSHFTSAQVIKKVHHVGSQGLTLHVNSFYDQKKLNNTTNILLVHGLTYSSHEFDIEYKDYSLVKALVSIGYQVWTMDVAGYGQSDKPLDGFDITTSYAALDVENVITYILSKVNKESIDLLGWSWGTMTTSLLVKNHSRKVRKLILYAPIVTGFDGKVPESNWHRNSWEHAASDFQLKNGHIDTLIMDKTVMNLFIANCWKYDQMESPNGARRELLKGKNKVFIESSSLKVPTLFIGGGNDPLLNWPEIQKLYSRIKNVKGNKLIKIPGAGHAMMMEKPFYHEFQKQVVKFLQH